MENIEEESVSQVPANNLVPALETHNVNTFDSKRQESLDYLLKQAEVYSHFVTNGSKLKNTKRKSTKSTVTKSTRKLRRRNENETISEDLNTSSVKVKVQFDQTPKYITGEMRDYQIRALNWLITLYENGINGILADEMGLGKTLQTISMLGYLKQYEKTNGPHLIVAPNSTLQNWLNEIGKFCPSLNGLILIGDKPARSDILKRMKKDDWDICITSYEMCLLEKGPLKRINWKYVVVDEAHRIKNEKAKLSQILRTFSTENRLLLTGTPLQNNLHELWSLLNYLLPNVFASSDDFDTWFDSDNCLRGNDDIVKRLHTILRPFMLRRIKSEVEKSLLPKIELKLFVGLTTIQRETYKKVLMKDVQTISSLGKASQKAINNILMELRKVANHPYLIEGIEPGPPYTTDQHLIDSCGKMMVLDKLLEKLKSQGSRVVLFSQFVMMLNVFEDYLMWKGYKYCRLDGQCSYDERANSIDDFNAKDSDKFVFILSTRAGGLGINLTTADTVIIYDSDWNPQSDFQAIDRVHRIGQTKQVRVFRLVTENTVDERIVQRAGIKTRLDKLIIQQGRTNENESAAEQRGMKRDMIRFGAKYILSSESSDVIDIDIEKILQNGELKTAEEDEKLIKLNENGLRTLTLEDVSSVSVYQFEGVDFRAMQDSSKSDELPEEGRPRRAAKRNRSAITAPAEDVNGNQFTTIHLHQFYPKHLYDLTEDGENLDMSYDTEHKQSLMDQGFSNWSELDYEQFCNALRRFGRNNLVQVANMIPGKTLHEVIKYNEVFWQRGRQYIEDFADLVRKIKKNEQSLLQKSKLAQALGVQNAPTSMLQPNACVPPLVISRIPIPAPIQKEQVQTMAAQAPKNIPGWQKHFSKWIVSDSVPKNTKPTTIPAKATSERAEQIKQAAVLVSQEKGTFSQLMNKFCELDESLNAALDGCSSSDDESSNSDTE